MALQRPRRIFRGSPFDSPRLRGRSLLQRMMLVGLAGAGIGAGLLMFGRPRTCSDRRRRRPGAVSADPLLVAVVDGATLRLHDTVVRLHGVAAPARGRTCPDGQGSRL